MGQAMSSKVLCIHVALSQVEASVRDYHLFNTLCTVKPRRLKPQDKMISSHYRHRWSCGSASAAHTASEQAASMEATS